MSMYDLNMRDRARKWLLDLGAPYNDLDDVLDAVFEGEISPQEAAYKLGFVPNNKCAIYTVEDAICEAAS